MCRKSWEVTLVGLPEASIIGIEIFCCYEPLTFVRDKEIFFQVIREIELLADSVLLLGVYNIVTKTATETRKQEIVFLIVRNMVWSFF